MNPSSLLQADIGTILSFVYVCVVVLIGIIGTANLAVLHKHAEKPNIARGITLTFAIIFLLICILSGVTIIRFLANA